MRLRWSNGVSRSVEFDSGRREEFAATLEDAYLSYRLPVPLPAAAGLMQCRRTYSGRIQVYSRGEKCQSQYAWDTLDEVRAAVAAGVLYVPPGAVLDYTVLPHVPLADLRAAYQAEQQAILSAHIARLATRGHVLVGSRESHPDECIALHIQADADRWVDPIFPPESETPTIHMPCNFANGQPVPSGIARLSLGRRTHVVVARYRLPGGAHQRGDWQIVHPEGYHTEPNPTLCGLYWNDWVLKIGPEHWHADAVYCACAAAVRASHNFTAFVGDVSDAMRFATDPGDDE